MRNADLLDQGFRFIRDTSAHVVVEHALFLALVAGCVVVAAEAVGFVSGDVFADVSHSLAGETAATTQAKSSAKSNRTAQTSAPLVTPALVATRPVSAWRLIAVSCVLIIGAGTWVLLYRRGLQQTAAETLIEDELPEGWNPEALFRKRQQVLRIISDDMDSLFESRLTIRHLMSTRVKTISPNLTENEACLIMEREQVRHLLVCRDDGSLIGIISNRDVRPDGRRRVSRAMSSELHTVTRDTLVSPAMTTLMKWRISCLPVVDGDQVLGVITTTDLMMALQVTLQMMQKVARQVSTDEVQKTDSDLQFAGSTNA
jgi:CBS domain-containing protein